MFHCSPPSFSCVFQGFRGWEGSRRLGEPRDPHWVLEAFAERTLGESGNLIGTGAGAGIGIDTGTPQEHVKVYV